MESKKVTDGNVEIHERTFYYECWSDNSDVTIKIFHQGKIGKVTKFNRQNKLPLKEEMTYALMNDGVIKK